jgi:hypothetical protein
MVKPAVKPRRIGVEARDIFLGLHVVAGQDIPEFPDARAGVTGGVFPGPAPGLVLRVVTQPECPDLAHPADRLDAAFHNGLGARPDMQFRFPVERRRLRIFPPFGGRALLLL